MFNQCETVLQIWNKNKVKYDKKDKKWVLEKPSQFIFVGARSSVVLYWRKFSRQYSTTLDIAPTNINCEGFSSTHFYLSIFFIILYLFYRIYIYSTVSHWLYLRSYVKELRINFNIIPFIFANNIVIICTTVKRTLSPFIPFLCIRHPPDDGRSGQPKHVVV